MVEEVIKIRAEVGEANKEIKKVGQSVDDLKDKANKTEKETKKIAAGFKNIGMAIKAAGIGLVIAAFAKLSEAFTRNQKVADTFSNAMNTVSIVFTQILDVFTNVVTKVSETSNGFTGLGNVISGLINIALTPLKLTFYGVMLAIDNARLAWEESFFGDKDPETIKMLQGRIIETQQSILEVGKKAIESGKQVYENFSQAVNEVSQVVKGTVNGISEINIEAAKQQAQALTEARKNAELAQVRLQGLIEKYDRQAEIQRQIRDDERLSIDERIAANDELGRVLEAQLEAQLNLANQRVAAARLEIQATGDNIENQRALQEALNEVAAVEAQVTGFRSEQLVNEAALQRERKENMNEIAKINRDEIELQRTEAQQLYEQRVDLINRTISDEQQKYAALEQAHKAYTKTVEDIDQKSAQIRKNIVAGLINAVLANLEQGSVEQKALAVAQATWNTFEAITNALKYGVPPFNYVQAVSTGLFGLAQVRQILNTNPTASASPSVSGGSISSAAFQPASVNIPGQSGINSIISGLQNNNQAIKAYVVTGEVTSGQELERKRLNNATFG